MQGQLTQIFSKTYWGLFSTLLLCASAYSQSIMAPAEDWIQMFNGADLTGWEFKIRGQETGVDSKNTFSVEGGLLVVDYSNYDNFNGEPFGHIWYTESEFSYYVMTIEYQFFGTQASGGPGWANKNNGIMYHSQSIETMGLNQDFPVSLEAQLLHQGGDWRTMNLCTPGTNHHNLNGELQTAHCVNASGSQGITDKEWVTASLVVLGDSIVHHVVEGDTVLSFTKPVTGGGSVSGHTITIENNAPLKKGYITLPGESAPTKFRKVEILNLVGCMDPLADNYRDYFLVNDAESCVTTSINSKAELSSLKGVVLNPQTLSLSITEPGSHKIEVRNIQGSLVFSKKGNLPTQYSLKNELGKHSRGVQLISVEINGNKAMQKTIVLN